MLKPEERISLQRARDIFGVSMPTIYRWVYDGFENFRLRTQRIGGRRFTSQAWIDEFVEHMNARDFATTGGPIHAA